MTVTAERFGAVLDGVADLASQIDAPADPQVRRWLLGKVQVAQIELEGLEARLVNNTPQPKTPASPRPVPGPGGTAPKGPGK